jgi:hypothetical protein
MSTTQTFAPYAGTDGRVKTSVGDVIIAGIKSWKRGSQAAPIPIPHFESSADATAFPTVQPNVLKGLGQNTVDLEGIYNTNAVAATETGNTALYNGAYVSLDLYISRTLGKGYDSVPGWVTNFAVTNTIDNQAVSFTCTVTVDGPFPLYGTVT